MTTSLTRKLLNYISLITLAACIVFSIYAYNRHLFTSQEALQAYIVGFGVAGAAVFILFQAVQVVFPVLPGGLGCLAGVLLFGPWMGLLYNYIGICIGSMAAFFIARCFGQTVLRSLFNDKTIRKYEKWTGSGSRFTWWFAIAIFLPVAPDDFLCYLAGTTRMDWKTFAAVILLGKPFAIALYSLGLYLGLQRLLPLVH